MNFARMLRELLIGDGRAILRDPLLKWLPLFLIIVGVLARLILPWCETRYSIDLAPHYPLVMSVVVVLLAPVILGYMVGVLMLDERDEGTLQAISVTPLPIWKYLLWKLSLPLLLTTVITMLLFPVIGVITLRWVHLPALVVGAMWAPLLALLMASLAQNKVQGFVLMRIGNIFLLLPMLAWFYPEWSPLLALLPAYWPMKSIWLAEANQNVFLTSIIGLVYHLVVIGLLYRRFLTTLRRSA